jgi:hypothetical protein
VSLYSAGAGERPPLAMPAVRAVAGILPAVTPSGWPCRRAGSEVTRHLREWCSDGRDVDGLLRAASGTCGAGPRSRRHIVSMVLSTRCAGTRCIRCASPKRVHDAVKSAPKSCPCIRQAMRGEPATGTLSVWRAHRELLRCQPALVNPRGLGCRLGPSKIESRWRGTRGTSRTRRIMRRVSRALP